MWKSLKRWPVLVALVVVVGVLAVGGRFFAPGGILLLVVKLS
jgi:hypothetical protein